MAGVLDGGREHRERSWMWGAIHSRTRALARAWASAQRSFVVDSVRFPMVFRLLIFEVFLHRHHHHHLEESKVTVLKSEMEMIVMKASDAVEVVELVEGRKSKFSPFSACLSQWGALAE